MISHSENIIKPKILIIEDEEALRLTLKEYLDLSYSVFMAGTGRQGLDYIREMTFEAILVDLNLPDFNGVEIVDTIRDTYQKTAILVITGDKKEDTVQSLIKAGADDYIVKPFNRGQLFDRLRKAILTRRIARQK